MDDLFEGLVGQQVRALQAQAEARGFRAPNLKEFMAVIQAQNDADVQLGRATPWTGDTFRALYQAPPSTPPRAPGQCVAGCGEEARYRVLLRCPLQAHDVVEVCNEHAIEMRTDRMGNTCSICNGPMVIERMRLIERVKVA